MAAKKKSKSSKNKKNKKKNRNKKTVVKPLIQKNPSPSAIQQKLENTAVHIAYQPEFDIILFPLFETTNSFVNRLHELEPNVFNLASAKKIDQKLLNIYYQVLEEIANELLANDPILVDDILESLSEIKERLEFTPDPVLEREVQLMWDYLGKAAMEDKLAQFPLIQELIIKHIHILQEFSKEVEKKLSQNFIDLLRNGPNDPDKFDEIVDAYDDRYPGFSDLLFPEIGEDDNDEDDAHITEFKKILMNGLDDVKYGNLQLKLFTKIELEEGLKLAEKFYAQLPASERLKVQNLHESFFEKAEEFREIILSYLKDVCTLQRRKNMAKEIEMLLQKKKYERWYNFLRYMSGIIVTTEDERDLIPTLSAFFAAQIREATRKTTKIYPLLFWYI